MQINFMTPPSSEISKYGKTAIYNWKSAKIAWLDADLPTPASLPSKSFFVSTLASQISSVIPSHSPSEESSQANKKYFL